MLETLERFPAKSILELVRREWPGRGHWAGYARVHRLAARGLVKIDAAGVSITTAGKSAIAE